MCTDGTDLECVDEKDENKIILVAGNDIDCISLNEMEYYAEWLPHCGCEAMEEEEELWDTYIQSAQVQSVLKHFKNPHIGVTRRELNKVSVNRAIAKAEISQLGHCVVAVKWLSKWYTSCVLQYDGGVIVLLVLNAALKSPIYERIWYLSNWIKTVTDCNALLICSWK